MIWSAGTGNKKYKVVLDNGKIVQFGDKRYQHYEDKTPLKLYSHLDHKNKKRRNLYILRHQKIRNKNYLASSDAKYAVDKLYSPAWFSLTYLW